MRVTQLRNARPMAAAPVRKFEPAARVRMERAATRRDTKERRDVEGSQSLGSEFCDVAPVGLNT